MPNSQREHYLSAVAQQLAPRLVSTTPFFLVEVAHFELVGAATSKQPFVISAIRYQSDDGTQSFGGNFSAAAAVRAVWAEHLP